MGLSTQQFEEYQAEFIERCQQVEEGNLSALECAVSFRNEYDYLTKMAEDRKAWMNENVDAITDEAEGYGKDGYNGLIFTKQVKETLSYKNIPEWAQASAGLKAIEQKSKDAYLQVKKGMMNVDAEGVEIPLPTVTTSSFIKVEKVKK
ncbi:MAG: hypothetical protein ACRC8Z_10815 [Empedobacter falsenii]